MSWYCFWSVITLMTAVFSSFFLSLAKIYSRNKVSPNENTTPDFQITRLQGKTVRFVKLFTGIVHTQYTLTESSACKAKTHSPSISHFKFQKSWDWEEVLVETSHNKRQISMGRITVLYKIAIATVYIDDSAFSGKGWRNESELSTWLS